MARPDVGECVYCGTNTELTREHVIPACLFPRPLPDKMITVGACGPCNNGKSLDDTYLRDYLLADMMSDTSAAALKLRNSKLKRSVQTNRSEIARMAIRWASLIAIQTASGLYAGRAMAVPVDADRLNTSYKNIVRGLHNHLTGQRIPNDYDFHVDRILPLQIVNRWDNMLDTNPGIIGTHAEVFIGLFRPVDGLPTFSRWSLLFYQAILIEVLACPYNGYKELLERLPVDPKTKLVLFDHS